jgi:hypothetical protein
MVPNSDGPVWFWDIGEMNTCDLPSMHSTFLVKAFTTLYSSHPMSETYSLLHTVQVVQRLTCSHKVWSFGIPDSIFSLGVNKLQLMSYERNDDKTSLRTWPIKFNLFLNNISTCPLGYSTERHPLPYPGRPTLHCSLYNHWRACRTHGDKVEEEQTSLSVDFITSIWLRTHKTCKK